MGCIRAMSFQIRGKTKIMNFIEPLYTVEEEEEEVKADLLLIVRQFHSFTVSSLPLIAAPRR